MRDARSNCCVLHARVAQRKSLLYLLTGADNTQTIRPWIPSATVKNRGGRLGRTANDRKAALVAFFRRAWVTKRPSHRARRARFAAVVRCETGPSDKFSDASVQVRHRRRGSR